MFSVCEIGTKRVLDLPLARVLMGMKCRPVSPPDLGVFYCFRHQRLAVWQRPVFRGGPTARCQQADLSNSFMSLNVVQIYFKSY